MTGTFNRGEKGACLGSTYVAVYDNSSLTSVMQSSGIGFEEYRWSELSLEVQFLGNKMADDGKRGRARNIWDLEAYNGRIYLGGGSTVENAGPVSVWAYDPATASFHNAYTVPEEAIELFRVFDADLYIPAADPTSGDMNKFYLGVAFENGSLKRASNSMRSTPLPGPIWGICIV